MIRYAITIFLSAFLLFQVQPMIGKYILPWFGGGPAVWTACMLFFQMALLGGYAYAHWISSRLTPKVQSSIHIGLLLLSLLCLPIAPNPDIWKPSTGEMPTLQIVGLLAAIIGLPYFLLSSTGPLLQESFRRETGQTPYRLYSLSNIGSLLALLTYPFVFEPQLKLSTQAYAWSSGYAVFVLLSVICAWYAMKLPAAQLEHRAAEESAKAPPPGWSEITIWLLLAACGSALLLATTNQIVLEVPPIPFLWIVPLALYLLTFIICFDGERWYHRETFFVLMALLVGLAQFAVEKGHHLPIWQQATIYSATMFVCCMVCHGELVNTKPAPEHATLFYLMVSAGGAVGGILVALVAPLVFNEYWEYPVALGATVVLGFLAAYKFSRVPLENWRLGLVLIVSCLALGRAIGINPTLALSASTQQQKLETTRNFYGILRVSDNWLPSREQLVWRSLKHGTIEHGLQFLDPHMRRVPTTYFAPTSGIGRALERHPDRFSSDLAKRALKIGVVGLGTGTLAAHGKPGDTISFYEINPEVERFSSEYFTFRSDSPAKVDVILGDARIELERQLAAGEDQHFDVLAIDAFSSDSIPVHLLTLESVKLYLEHLEPDGILCLHITNRFLDLGPVVRGISEALDMPLVFIERKRDDAAAAYYSLWAILTFNEKFLADPEIAAAVKASNQMDKPPVLWTDDYASLWRVLREFNDWSKLDDAEGESLTEPKVAEPKMADQQGPKPGQTLPASDQKTSGN